jgi:hypothetical protein
MGITLSSSAWTSSQRGLIIFRTYPSPRFALCLLPVFTLVAVAVLAPPPPTEGAPPPLPRKRAAPPHRLIGAASPPHQSHADPLPIPCIVRAPPRFTGATPPLYMSPRAAPPPWNRRADPRHRTARMWLLSLGLWVNYLIMSCLVLCLL